MTTEKSKSTAKVFGVMAEFETPDDILAAAHKVREQGYTRTDALTPFPIHGWDEALGMRRSILGYIVAPVGVLGIIAALLLQWYTSDVDYPLVVGGKPFFAFEPSIPVTFELMVLFASFAAVIAMFALNGLPRFHHPVFNYSAIRGASDDRFLLVIEKADPLFSQEKASAFLESLGGKQVEVVTE
jgi:hypothetical protein